MTQEVQSISHDKHMRIVVIPPPMVATKQDDPLLLGLLQGMKNAEENYAFVRVEILPGNVGYLDFRNFTDPAVGRETASAAMKFIENGDKAKAIESYEKSLKLNPANKNAEKVLSEIRSKG